MNALQVPLAVTFIANFTPFSPIVDGVALRNLCFVLFFLWLRTEDACSNESATVRLRVRCPAEADCVHPSLLELRI